MIHNYLKPKRSTQKHSTNEVSTVRKLLLQADESNGWALSAELRVDRPPLPRTDEPQEGAK